MGIDLKKNPPNAVLGGSGLYARKLKVTPECWTMMLSRPEGFRVAEHRLPRDARLAGPHELFGHDSVEVNYVELAPGLKGGWCVDIWLASASFKATDPAYLPDPILRAIRPDNSEDIPLGYGWWEGEKEEPAKPEEPKPIRFREFT